MNPESLWERLARILLLVSVLMTLTTVARAQQILVPVTDTLTAQTAQSSAEEEEDFIKPSRPGIANPAEIHKAGVLQLEYGYDADFRAAEFRTEQSAPLTLRFAATSRLLLQADLDTIKSETDETGMRQTGIGDTRLGFQLVALKDTEQHPALAFAYYINLPTASKEKGLGTGRVDHKLVLLLSKKFGETDVDFNTALLIVGHEDIANRWVNGGQFALSFSREFENNFGVEGELSGQSKDDEQPKGLFALGALTYKVNRRLILDAGMRFGLNADAPRVGVFAGMTIGIADLYKKK